MVFLNLEKQQKSSFFTRLEACRLKLNINFKLLDKDSQTVLENLNKHSRYPGIKISEQTKNIVIDPMPRLSDESEIEKLLECLKAVLTAKIEASLKIKEEKGALQTRGPMGLKDISILEKHRLMYWTLALLEVIRFTILLMVKN